MSSQIDDVKVSKFLFLSIVAAFLIVGFLIRFSLSIDPSIWADEGQHILIVGAKDLFGMREIYRTTATDQPFGMYPLLYLWKIVFGWSPISMRLFSVTFSSATIGVFSYGVWVLTKSRWASIFAAILICLSPVSIRYGYDVTPYAIVQFFGTLSVILFLKSWKEKNYSFSLGLVLANCILLNLHYYSYLFVGAQFLLFIFVAVKKRISKDSYKLLHAAGIFLIASIPILLLFDPDLAQNNHWWIDKNRRSVFDILTNLLAYGDIHSWILLIVATSAIAWQRFRRDPLKRNVMEGLALPAILICILMVAFALVLSKLLWNVVGSERYFIILVPCIGLVLLKAILGNQSLKMQLATGVIVFTLMGYDSARHLPRQSIQDFEGAANYVNRIVEESPDSIILIPECCRWALDYYFEIKEIKTTRMIPNPNLLASDPVYRQRLASNLTKKYRGKIILVLYYQSLKMQETYRRNLEDVLLLSSEKKLDGVHVLVYEGSSPR